MAWAHGRSCAVANTSGTTVSITLSGTVSVGDTVFIAISYNYIGVGDTTVLSSSGTLADNKDSLGNLYTRVTDVLDSGDGQSIDGYSAVITAGGTPTFRFQSAHLPGTTSLAGVWITGDHFTGSNAASTINGSAGQEQAPGGTTANAINSSAYTTTQNGSLLFGVTTNVSEAATTITSAGTSSVTFTNYTGTADHQQQNEAGPQTTAAAGTISAFTNATDGGNNFLTLGWAVSPASGAAIVDDDPVIPFLPPSDDRIVTVYG